VHRPYRAAKGVRIPTAVVRACALGEECAIAVAERSCDHRSGVRGFVASAVYTGSAAAGVVLRSARRQVEAATLMALEAALASRIAEEAMDRALESRLASRSLDRVVEEVAQSPAVLDAVTQQSAGFADQVADRMRARSRNADAWLERKARRALRRAPP
jgi:hypothetical protein